MERPGSEETSIVHWILNLGGESLQGSVGGRERGGAHDKRVP